MSIPKEPRQLMINIMYLVLTALLALNVSAEIFNAFKIVDKGIVKSNKAIDSANDNLPDAIRTGAKKKASLATYADRIDPIRAKADEMSDYIDQMINKMIDESGDNNGSVDAGDYITISGVEELKGKKNKDVTTRYLVNGGAGEELKAKLMAFREEMLTFYDEDDKEQGMKDVPTIVDDATWKDKVGKESWSDFNFKQMPVQATIPILRKFQNDIKGSESSLLNYLANKVGTTTEVVLDKFTVVSAPEKTYVIKGEKFGTDVFLSASAGSDSNTGISISVNGRKLPVDKDGNARFEENASAVGVRKYNAAITVTNPATGETQTYKKTYEYEVGERSVSVSASKMNVFYIGVNNPVEVSAAGVPSSQVKVNMGGSGGCSVNKNGDGTYGVKCSNITPKGQFAKVNVTAPGMNAAKDFRVKRIPDPVAMIGKKRGGSMGNGEFKLYSSIRGDLSNFDFDAKCSIKGFKLVYAPARQDPEISVNPGGKYNAKSQALAQKAKPGDKYYFEDIKCTCPGDKASRDLGALNVRIN